MEGLLLVDKPVGWTSFDVVKRIRGVIARELGIKPKNFKVGHTGTLDPAASGLLVLCAGKKYTKMVPDLIKHDKIYESEITFGVSSSTGDSEGVLSVDDNIRIISRQQLAVVLKKYIGVLEQTPPVYSAIKVGGKRAYELAREGKDFKLKSRKIRVYSIELNSFEWPVAKVVCRVGSGTYVRTLAEDIGHSLGVGAYLSDLRRTKVDSWRVEDAISPEDVGVDMIKEKLLVNSDGSW